MLSKVEDLFRPDDQAATFAFAICSVVEELPSAVGSGVEAGVCFLTPSPLTNQWPSSPHPSRVTVSINKTSTCYIHNISPPPGPARAVEPVDDNSLAFPQVQPGQSNPLMITPYRHNWLISGNAADTPADQKGTWWEQLSAEVANFLPESLTSCSPWGSSEAQSAAEAADESGSKPTEKPAEEKPKPQVVASGGCGGCDNC